jgi:hypothetical protein
MQEMPPRRAIHSLYARDRPEEPKLELRRRRGKRPSSSRTTTQTPVEEAATMEVADAGGSSSSSYSGDEATSRDEATTGGSTSSGVLTPYFRGPVKLLRRPIPEVARPLITPYRDR